ncbi:MAG: DUF5916 domain-containing protein [Vicinamibacterales bacterium]
MKYGITSNLTADITVKTDFAQVEVDEQQLNLTRFSLQFPEKRDFFLEGRGIFDFGRGGGSNGATLGFGSGGNSSPSTGAPTFLLQPAHRSRERTRRPHSRRWACHRTRRQVDARCAQHRNG